MAKIWLKYIVAVLMIISFILVGITSLMMDDDWSIRNDIINSGHHAFGIIFLVLIGIHLLLHIDWIWAMTKRIFVKN